MDESLESIEAELKGLRPAGPSESLRRRIHDDLTIAKSNRRVLGWIGAIALPVAACVIGLLLLEADERIPPPDRTPVAMNPVALKPVLAEHVLYAATDEGVVLLEDGTRARRERLKFVDTLIWQDPSARASLTWTVPREEVRVVPASYQ